MIVSLRFAIATGMTFLLDDGDKEMLINSFFFREAGIFDMRYTSENKDDLAVPVMGFPKAPKGIHGAFFSPITGKYVLTTCTDDTLKLYDVQKSNSEAECKSQILIFKNKMDENVFRYRHQIH